MRVLSTTAVQTKDKDTIAIVDDLGPEAVFGSLHRDGKRRILKLLAENPSMQLDYDRVRYLPVVNIETGEVGIILRGTVVTPYLQVFLGLEDSDG